MNAASLLSAFSGGDQAPGLMSVSRKTMEAACRQWCFMVWATSGWKMLAIPNCKNRVTPSCGSPPAPSAAPICASCAAQSRRSGRYWRLPPTAQTFPIGLAMNRNLTTRMGNCNHRRYLPCLVGLVRGGLAQSQAGAAEPAPCGLVSLLCFLTLLKRAPGLGARVCLFISPVI